MGENSTIEATDLAYLAGMIDGDGYISITRSCRRGRLYFAPQVGIAGTRREPHDFAASIWGGKVSCYFPRNPLHRPQFQWSRVGASAVLVIEAIRPYLLVKERHAELAIELFEHVTCSKSDDPFPWFSPCYDSVAEMERMRSEMISLNQSRNRVGRRNAGHDRMMIRRF